MNKTIKKKRTSIIILSMIALLAVVAAAGIAVKRFYSPAVGITAENDAGKVTDELGELLSDGEIHAMPANMLFSPELRLLSAEGGEQPLTARISASVTPQNAKDKTADWEVSFVNGESEWASGKEVTDYVTVTPDSVGSLVATVSCKQAFGERIKLTATSRDNDSASVFCILDYKQQYLGIDLTLSQTGKTPSVNNDTKKGTVYADFESEEPLTVSYTYKKSEVYTAELSDDEISAPSLTVSYKDALKTALNNVKAGLGTIAEVTAGEKSFGLNLLNASFTEGLTAEQTNGAISAIDGNKANAVIFSFTGESGDLIAQYSFTVVTTEIKEQMRVTGITLDKTRIVFGGDETIYNITYRKAGAANTALTLFEKGSEYGLSKATGGFYPETYKSGETVNVSDLKTRFSCSGAGGDYHSGNGSGTAEYKFLGWYWDNEKTRPFDGTIPAGTTGDITLYAEITAIATHSY